MLETGDIDCQAWKTDKNKMVELTLTNVLHVPGDLHVVSLSKVWNRGGGVVRDSTRDKLYLQIREGFRIQLQERPSGLSFMKIQVPHTVVVNTMKEKASQHKVNINRLHAQLDHQGENHLRQFIRDQGLKVTGELHECETCVTWKSERKPFKGKSAAVTAPLECVHIDLMGPLETQTLGGNKMVFLA